MSDKQGQQRRGRADGAIRSAVDRCPGGKDPALAPETKETPPGRTTACRRPQSAGRHLVDSAQRGSLVRFAGGVSLAFDLLAATARLGGAIGLVRNLAHVPE